MKTIERFKMGEMVESVEHGCDWLRTVEHGQKWLKRFQTFKTVSNISVRTTPEQQMYHQNVSSNVSSKVLSKLLIQMSYENVSDMYNKCLLPTERWDNLSIFKGQSNIRTVANVTNNRPSPKQRREYRAFQIFQSIEN